MLRSANEILGYGLYASNEDVGTCKDLLFDDRWWTIRHMQANTGGWLTGRKVLVSPMMVTKVDWKTRKIFLNVSKDKIENCPELSEDEPVSREYENQLAFYYGHPQYWHYAGLWGTAAYPSAAMVNSELIPTRFKTNPADKEKPNHLRSLEEVTGYHIKAEDGNIGHVEEFIIDDETWALRYVIVDTRNWLPGGKKVLLPLKWAKSVNWKDSEFSVTLTKEEVENGPEFDPSKPINTEYELNVYDYYGRPFDAVIDKTTQQYIANPFV